MTAHSTSAQQCVINHAVRPYKAAGGALCGKPYVGDKGLSTCWRPGTIAQNIVCTAMADAHFTPIRYCQV